MQWLKLVSEDAGVQRLRSEARRPATTRGVSAVAPYPKAHPVHVGEDSNTRQKPKPIKDRRYGERRKGDRRKQQKAVMLDTRSRHDRRNIDNRRQAQSGNKEATPSSTRVNLYA